MKWKMAENSLFAVLLRSPWWISFAVVAAFALASRALLPPQYMAFGVMGGFPFLVIGVIAALRQYRSLNPEQVARTLQAAAAMSWRDFCGMVEQAYRKDGYQVSRLDGQSADLLLAKAGLSTLVACKRWKAANHGIGPLRALHETRQNQDASRCIYVTLAQVSDNTRRFALANKIELLQGAALAQLLHKVAPR